MLRHSDKLASIIIAALAFVVVSVITNNIHGSN